MKFKGTIGTWKVYNLHTESFKIISMIDDKEGFEVIANTNEHLDEVDQEHNAKLISAAPELLEALKCLIDPVTGLVADFIANEIGKESSFKIEQSIYKALGNKPSLGKDFFKLLND